MQTPVTPYRVISFNAVVGLLVLANPWASATAATTQERYYALAAVQDRDGVIAPW
jgi:hypothetical protein